MDVVEESTTDLELQNLMTQSKVVSDSLNVCDQKPPIKKDPKLLIPNRSAAEHQALREAILEINNKHDDDD